MNGEIVATRRGRAGVVTIDRPRALNALDLDMFAAVGEVLRTFRDDPAIDAVVIRGAGGHFSAGGDIRAVRKAALAGDTGYNARLYFEEYRLNALIDGYPKPYVAAIDGYGMGGGLGLAMHGTFRVVSKRAILAMPETGIGFFPDVGSSYVFPRLADRLGWYAGLTGARLTAADALACGLATHHLDDDDAFARIDEIVAEDPTAVGIATRLAALAADPGPSLFDTARAGIARCFDQPALLDVIAALERESEPWAGDALAMMRRASPTSVAMTFELFRRGSTLDLGTCLEMEYQLAKRQCDDPEFLEGVRAMVVDKDRAPHWQPARIEDVRDAAVQAKWRDVDTSRNELQLR